MYYSVAVSRLRLLLSVVALWAVGASAPASASDFWDEVRSPGLRAYRTSVELAGTALRGGDAARALTAADAAVARIEDRAEGHVLRAQALAELGRRDDALVSLRRGLELDPTAADSPEAGGALARAAASAGEPELGARLLRRVLSAMPRTVRRRHLYLLYGDVSSLLGPAGLREAILAYREAFQASREMDQRAGLGLALSLLRTGEHAGEARDVAHKAARRGRMDDLFSSSVLPEAERAARLAVGLEALGDVPAARAAWTRARAPGPFPEFARAQLERLSPVPTARRRSPR